MGLYNSIFVWAIHIYPFDYFI